MKQIIKAIITVIKANYELNAITWFFMSALITAIWIVNLIKNCIYYSTTEHKIAIVMVIIFYIIYDIYLYQEIKKEAAKTKLLLNTNPLITQQLNNCIDIIEMRYKDYLDCAKGDKIKNYNPDLADDFKESVHKYFKIKYYRENQPSPYISNNIVDFYKKITPDRTARYLKILDEIDEANKLFESYNYNENHNLDETEKFNIWLSTQKEFNKSQQL